MASFKGPTRLVASDIKPEILKTCPNPDHHVRQTFLIHENLTELKRYGNSSVWLICSNTTIVKRNTLIVFTRTRETNSAVLCTLQIVASGAN